MRALSLLIALAANAQYIPPSGGGGGGGSAPGSPSNTLQINNGAGGFAAVASSFNGTILRQGDNQSHGLDDFSVSGSYTGPQPTSAGNAVVYFIRLSSTGTPDSFTWSNTLGEGPTAASITGSNQLLSYGVSIRFSATTGHTLNDSWAVTAGQILISGSRFQPDGSLNLGNWIYQTGQITELYEATSGTHSVTGPNFGSAIMCDASGGNVTLLLPNTDFWADFWFGAWALVVKKVDVTANTCTLVAANSGTIDLSPTYVLTQPYQSVTMSTNSIGFDGWAVISEHQPGVSSSGSVCTITAIDRGLIIAATCTP